MSPTGSRIKQFILDEFLPGEDPANLHEDTPLVSGGVLDSLATIRLVAFLEQTFGITISPHETTIDRVDKLSDFVALVERKQAGNPA